MNETTPGRILQHKGTRWIWFAIGVISFGALMGAREDFELRWQRGLLSGCAAAILLVCISRFQKGERLR
jgi:hypothetical protein